MKHFDIETYRKATIKFWSAFTHPGNEIDIARVYAFRELDPDTATDAQVNIAYGGPGWAPVPLCVECGHRGRIVVFGRDDVALCSDCITTIAAALTPVPEAPVPEAPVPEAPAKKGLFSRLLGV